MNLSALGGDTSPGVVKMLTSPVSLTDRFPGETFVVDDVSVPCPSPWFPESSDEGEDPVGDDDRAASENTCWIVARLSGGVCTTGDETMC